MTSWGPTVLAIFVLGAITFTYRYSFISSFGRKWAEKIPQDFLKLLAPTTFSTIIANNLVSHSSSPFELKQKSIASVVSLVIAYFSRSILLTLALGLGLLFWIQN